MWRSSGQDTLDNPGYLRRLCVTIPCTNNVNVRTSLKQTYPSHCKRNLVALEAQLDFHLTSHQLQSQKSATALYRDLATQITDFTQHWNNDPEITLRPCLKCECDHSMTPFSVFVHSNRCFVLAESMCSLILLRHLSTRHTLKTQEGFECGPNFIEPPR